MNLRRRIYSIILIASGVMLVVLTALIVLLVYSNSSAIDNQLAADNSNRVSQAIEQDLEKLTANAVSWGYWTDANNFLATQNQDFLTNELNEETLAASGFQIIMYLDKNRNIVFGRSINPETGKVEDVPQGLLQYLIFNPSLFQQKSLTDKITGIISTPEGPFLVSSLNVINSDNTGPSNGYIVVSEPLAERSLNRIGSLTGLNLESYLVSSTANPPEVQAAKAALTSGQAIHLSQLGNGYVAAYILLKDILGQPASILKITFPSTVYAQITNILRFLIPALLIIALGYGLTITRLMNRYVVDPLTSLDTDLESINRSSEAGLRVREVGDKEIKSLSTSINSLLSANEISESDLKRSLNQLLTISEINRSISGLLDPETILPEVVELIRSRLDLYYVGIFLLDQNKEFAILRAGTGDAGKSMLAAGHKLAVGGVSMIGWSTAAQKPRIALDVGKDAIRFSNPYLPDTRSELAIPIISRNVTIGALTLQSNRQNAFNDNDILAFQSIANSLAVALENANLFQDTQANLQEIRTLNRIYMQRSWSDQNVDQNALSYTIENAKAATGNSSPATVRFPLLLRDQPLGEIALEVEKDTLSFEDQAIISAIADQTAQALENVRLLEETRNRATREEKINDLVLKFSGAGSLDDILKIAAQEIGMIPAVSEVNVHLSAEKEKRPGEEQANNPSQETQS